MPLILILILTIAQSPHANAFGLPNSSWQNPKTAEDYNNRGLDRQNSGDLDGAITDYTKALSFKTIAAVQATIYNNRANAFMAKNDLAAAIADYSSAIQLQPSNYENCSPGAKSQILQCEH
jgi:tetratricopeptide (TPR) repeat protein